MFVADASEPNPSLGVGTSLDEPVGDFNLTLIDLVLAGLDVDRHKLVRLRVHVDGWAHAPLEDLVSPQRIVPKRGAPAPVVLKFFKRDVSSLAVPEADLKLPE